MPYIDGFELAAYIRAEGYNTPIIFLTAANQIEAKVQGFLSGADDYINKPYNHKELILRIRAVMRRFKKKI